MGAIDRIVQAVTGRPADTESGPSDASGPAAASGDTNVPPTVGPADAASGAQPSDGPSGVSDAETALGGADAVPDTPDGVVENYT